MQPVMWFEELSVGDVDLVGGKGANLGELTGAGLPVPPGFVVTAGAYRDAIEHSGIRSKLVDLLDRMDIDDPSSLSRSPRSPEPRRRDAGVSGAPHRGARRLPQAG